MAKITRSRPVGSRKKERNRSTNKEERERTKAQPRLPEALVQIDLANRLFGSSTGQVKFGLSDILGRFGLGQ